ncbi:MAG: hypothetical protein IJX50_04585 [Clostridia bacterium]|nr:hypothetical protein [Clostridia bacterium]
MSYNFAIIDLGSNSVRMNINAIEKDGSWSTLQKLRATVRLSEGMSSDNFLKENAINRVIDALCDFCDKAKEYKCVSIAAVATAALRNAANKELFLARVKEKTGIDFEIISGEQEAFYSFLAVRETVGIENGVIYDTGGGSTEIMLVKDGEIKHCVSLPLGAVIMTEKFRKSSQMHLYKYVSSYIGGIDWLDECEGLPLYGIGGSARALAMLYKKENLGIDAFDGMKIPYASVAKIYQSIFLTPVEKRKDIKGMEISRADIILAGLTPLKVLMDMCGGSSVTICASGVKEGVFFRMKDEILRSSNK